MIPLSIPNLKGNELNYVTKALKEGWVSTGGDFIKRFETDFANYLKVDQSVACQSGTAGLHLALLLSGVKSSHEVIVPSLTFIAAVNPVKYLGAEPVFMDCDDSLTIDVKKLEIFFQKECWITDNGLINKKTNKLIKTIVVVHVFGNMANMEKIMEIAKKYKLKVIEDATEALGTYYTSGKFKGRFAGTIGDFGVYSFNGNKIITTGGGGMLVAKDKEIVEKAKYLSTQAKDDPLYYVHNDIGYNYRMTNIQAAMGVAQLEQLENFIHIKKINYQTYQENIKRIKGLSLLDFKAGTRPNYWFYSLVIDKKAYGIDRDQLLVKLAENGIQTRPIWGLIHEQKPYVNNQAYAIEKAKKYVQFILNIPCSSSLRRVEVLKVTDVLGKLES
ncbi:LegC family aminotransferase [Oceanobacillus senegalensis]|uniref:LegC family aminotransferase n=1 Tax=Oceanobacillus senegalensis TaxID=1936063 RepID=UPI000A31112A|nr:LegC family aminotransferase [Oceanobacillus senegalensis]